jgi:hypothetical protein
MKCNSIIKQCQQYYTMFNNLFFRKLAIHKPFHKFFISKGKSYRMANKSSYRNFQNG